MYPNGQFYNLTFMPLSGISGDIHTNFKFFMGLFTEKKWSLSCSPEATCNLNLYKHLNKCLQKYFWDYSACSTKYQVQLLTAVRDADTGQLGVFWLLVGFPFKVRLQFLLVVRCSKIASFFGYVNFYVCPAIQ